jgi:hypothetical protein
MKAPIVCLADAASVSIEGKLIIHGAFDILWAEQVPVSWPLMVFVAKLTVSEEDIGQYPFELRVLDDDMNLVAKLASGDMALSDNPNPGIETGIPIIIQVLGSTFPKFGTYLFSLAIKGAEVCACYLHILQKPAES